MSLDFPANQYLPAIRRRASVAPMLIGVALAAIALAGQTRLGAWLRGFLAPREPLSRRLAHNLPLHMLRERVLGRRKSAVVSLCGPPRTAAISAGHVTTAAIFWRADTWYYAIDPSTQTAMAVRFVNGVASEVDFFGVPEQ